MPGRLAAALRRFASRSVQIEQEILRNPEFRTLCEDYGDAVAALERWRRSTDSIALKRASEYDKLVQELEIEISNYLQTLTDD